METTLALQIFLETNSPIKTWRHLREALSFLSEEQLNADLTIELGQEDECFAAEFRVCGETHYSLEDGHPVLFAK